MSHIRQTFAVGLGLGVNSKQNVWPYILQSCTGHGTGMEVSLTWCIVAYEMPGTYIF